MEALVEPVAVFALSAGAPEIEVIILELDTKGGGRASATYITPTSRAKALTALGLKVNMISRRTLYLFSAKLD